MGAEVPVSNPDAPAPEGPASAVAFQYTQTESFVALLKKLDLSLVITTYQANKLLVVRARDNALSVLVRTFDRPMGLAVDAQRFAIGCRREVWFLRDAPDLAAQVDPPGCHDACYLPRNCHVTGDIGVHDAAWAGSELWLVSTRFSCLATLHPDYSFVPRWQPPFVSALAAEDRCHLNGLAVAPDAAGRPVPRFVTALGISDAPAGWRQDRARGGCLIDVAHNAILARGLSMPHSPRCSQGQLWVLESGTGKLLLLDSEGQGRDVVTGLPGFARGLAICGDHALIGLSRIRPTSAMDGVPLAAQRDSLICGVAAVDLRRGHLIGLLHFQSAVEEIYDVQILQGARFPEVIGFQKESLSHTFVVPDRQAPLRCFLDNPWPPARSCGLAPREANQPALRFGRTAAGS
jgi:uncharacterized protein (TIGR03032 family)